MTRRTPSESGNDALGCKASGPANLFKRLGKRSRMSASTARQSRSSAHGGAALSPSQSGPSTRSWTMTTCSTVSAIDQVRGSGLNVACASETPLIAPTIASCDCRRHKRAWANSGSDSVSFARAVRDVGDDIICSMKSGRRSDSSASTVMTFEFPADRQHAKQNFTSHVNRGAAREHGELALKLTSQ